MKIVPNLYSIKLTFMYQSIQSRSSNLFHKGMSVKMVFHSQWCAHSYFQ